MATPETRPIRQWPAAERPRERFFDAGPDTLSNAELLALVLRSGSGRLDAVSFARNILVEFGGLRPLLDASVPELLDQPGLGQAKIAALKAGLLLAERYLKAPLERGSVLSDPEAAGAYLQRRLGSRKQEVFGCLFLDNQHRCLGFEELFFGTIDGASVYPREVLRRVMSFNAAAVIFVHNHPSGVAEPSRSDVQLTRRLKELLLQIDARVLDHLVVSADEVVSLARRGLL